MGTWQPLRSIERSRLTPARLAAHYAAQWLARAARAYIPPAANDSHTNFGWDHGLGGFATHPLPDGSRLALRIADMTLLLSGARDGEQALSLRDRNDADIRAWLAPQLAAKGFDPAALDKMSPYAMPDSPIATGARYPLDGLEPALGALAGWYHNASIALDTVRQELVASGLRAPPVRCWPHHFDLDTLIYFDAQNTRSMGVGFSPGDEHYDEPYFYVSLYPAPDVTTLPALPLGHWHSHHFTAAVATSGHIVSEDDQGAAVASFLRAATGIVIGALSVQPAE
jgi:hypothetical protein